MTLMINLSHELEQRLSDEARRRGVKPEDVLFNFIEQLPPPQGSPQRNSDAILELFKQWDEEDANLSPEEIAKREREFEEFKTAINSTREELGMRKIYP